MRTTVAAVVIVGLALAAGGVALVMTMRNSLTNEARDTARLRASDVAGALVAGTPAERLTGSADDDLVIQIVDGSGRVVSESPVLGAGAATMPVEAGLTRELQVDGDRYVAAAASVDTDEGARTVVAARTLESVEESTELIVQLLLIGLPLLLSIVGVTTWFLAGRALAPVEAMRSEVDEISAAALARRVPQPFGRDEIARLATTMNQMLDRLERAQVQQRQFVSDASHELRSPVASIREVAEVASAHPESTTIAELAEHVLAEDLRVQRLVEDLLMLTRADEQTLRLSRRPVDLDDVVFGEARRLRRNNGLRIDTSGVSAARVVGDESALRHVVANLAENAVRHARSQVSFTLAEDGGSAVLAIEDDGEGIPDAERERVFERFVRLDDARARDSGGSGLGLAIVAQLVAAHDGTVRLDSSREGGTRAEVRLTTVESQM
jgi:signal transduction histidine kinase